MSFIGRINLPDHKVPVRAYVHESGFQSAYDSNPTTVGSHLEKLLNGSLWYRLDPFTFVLAELWGEDKDKMIDFFGVKCTDAHWPGNPIYSSWITKNGVLVPQSRSPSKYEVTCGDGIILVGQEEAYRRTTRDLRDFANRPPTIPGLKLDIQIDKDR